MLITTDSPVIQLVKPRSWGRQRLGYCPGGPADRFSAAISNYLVGNPEDTALFELTLGAGQMRCTEETIIAICGAKMEFQCNGSPLKPNKTQRIPAGSSLEWGHAQQGCRTYIAAAGGICATDSPWQYLTASAKTLSTRHRNPLTAITRWYPRRQTIRFLPGPESDDRTLEYLLANRWQVGIKSNHQGIRLTGQEPPEAKSIASAPVLDGTIQLAPSEPIILLRGRQTVGGYPRIGQVISCDIDLLAQYQPGQQFHLELVSDSEALYYSRLQRDSLQGAVTPTWNA